MENLVERIYILMKSILILNLIFHNSFIYAMDLEVCLDQFDIHHNMIIRTEESLTIGGIFLQSTRLDTEIECRRLCCETEKCDVYIFEEKNESYCYVFSCGPPENFKCKFTKHANFTSSVLIPVIRYSTTSTTTTTIKPTLFQQLKIQSIQPISQQELELTNLKSSKANQNLNTIKTATAGPLTQNSLKSASQSCGRFQFKCHSGECIGIYNACNGIPQCEDGSDEGPECTENNVVENTSGKAQNRITNIKQNSVQSNPRQYQPVEIPTLNNREDPMSSPPIWMNRRPNQDMHSNMGDIQIPGNMPNQPNNIYIPLSNMQNPYILKPADHMMMMPPNMNWDPSAIKQLQQIAPMNNLPFDGINHINNENNNERFNQQQQKLQPQLQSPSAIKITQDNLDNLPSPQNIVTASENSINTNVPENQKTPVLNKQQNAELSEDSTETSGEYTQAAKKTSNKHNKKQKEQETENKINEQKDFVETYPFHEEYRMEFKDHDGYSDRPSGAIISLVLGLLVTACLALLIGCKMRTVGRRRVRIKGSFNDADFLVNGMYL